jgi:dipeptidyl aminopeptidase/acylaminoacyl peptidase
MASENEAQKKRIRLAEKPSPITTELVALAGHSFSDVQSDAGGGGGGGGRVYFACRDPSKQGRATVQSVSSSSSAADEDSPVVVHTTESHNVRSAVHEYGGGAFCVGPGGEGVIYTNFPDHTVHWAMSADQEEVPRRIFPAAGEEATKSPCRFANFSVNEIRGETVLLAVQEDHTDPSPARVVNSVVTISLDGRGTIQMLASGNDFYSYPCYDSTKERLAFVTWNHPNMPWDSNALCVVPDMVSGDVTLIEEGSSVYAPQWHGEKLYYLSNKTGWYNLYCWNFDGPQPLLKMDADFSESSCGWILGINCFTFLEDGTLAATYAPRDGEKPKDIGSKVVLISTKDNSIVGTFGRTCLPPTSIGSLTACGNTLYFLGGSTNAPTGLWRWERPGDESCIATEVLSSMKGKDLTPIQKYLSRPKQIRFPSTSVGLGFAYGYYYPPSQEVCVTPPLLVKAHGGPTARTSTTFRLDIQFWTSRGFAVLDVDYGGSTGYGRDYQQSLRGKWGLLDVADVCSGAEYCVKQGWINENFICIDGGSAGGYTTLAALAFKDVFRAGASKYGIGDLTALARETHKFESRYLDGLIAPYPKGKAVYDERCPLNYVDKMSCPTILLQGDEDKVVPPDQAETMFQALTSKGLAAALVMYKGEQHGFRNAKNISHALLSEYFFFCETFGLEPQPEEDFEGVKPGTRIVINNSS